jgi:hypothetical protein
VRQRARGSVLSREVEGHFAPGTVENGSGGTSSATPHLTRCHACCGQDAARSGVRAFALKLVRGFERVTSELEAGRDERS